MEDAMKQVLAAIDESSVASHVLRAAATMARTLGAEPRVLHVREGKAEQPIALARRAGLSIDVVDGDPIERIVEWSDDRAVRVVALGMRRERPPRLGTGHVASAVMSRVKKPVLLIPPGVRLPSEERFARVLIPLEGSAPSSAAIGAELRAFQGEGVAITVLHVMPAGTAPKFWDQPGHAAQTWSTEFRARWCDQPGTEFRLRRGDVVPVILDTAATEGADVIVLGWSQKMSHNRARVVRGIVGQVEIPVLLTPTDG
jgi:nucleotide-binding universal stress UspA family protein